MAFKKMIKQQYPPRLWELVGYPGCGKTTFASQMRGPMVVVDADHRFTEVLAIANDIVYQLSDDPVDNVDPDRVAARLAENMPGSGVKTIVVDSLTAIITPLVVQAMVDKDAGRIKNQSAGFRGKALAMRQLQDAVTRWGCDCLWIYHLMDARDQNAQALTRATVSKTELARLMRSINLRLEIVQQGAKRGIKVTWARRGRAGMVIWDESGCWTGMPERIEAAVYDGLTKEQQDEIEKQTPVTFPDDAQAIAWGLEQNCFEALPHARNAFEKLQRESPELQGEELYALWVAEVQARVAEGQAAPSDDAPAAGQPQTPAPAPPVAPALNGTPRPYPPAVLKAKLTERAATHTGEATAKQRGLLAMLLELAFAGDGESQKKRRAVQQYLWGVDSLNDLSDGMVLACLNDWLRPTKDDGGAYFLDKVSAQEISAVYREVLVAAGQGSLLDEFFPREPAPTPPEEVVPDGATQFWAKFHEMKGKGQISDVLRSAPEIAQAQKSDDWSAAIKWLKAQARR